MMSRGGEEKANIGQNVTSQDQDQAVCTSQLHLQWSATKFQNHLPKCTENLHQRLFSLHIVHFYENFCCVGNPQIPSLYCVNPHLFAYNVALFLNMTKAQQMLYRPKCSLRAAGYLVTVLQLS